MTDRCATAELLDEAIGILEEVRIMSVNYKPTEKRISAFLTRMAKYNDDPDMTYVYGEFQPVESRYECDEQ